MNPTPMNTPETASVAARKSGMVAIAGRPNAGKSTLLNRVVGEELSIVTPKAQTTREQLRGILNAEAHGQMVFVDTPGIHRAREGGINEAMVHQARMALEAPDAVWYLVDPLSRLEHEEPVIELLKGVKAPVWVVLNKSDRPVPNPRPSAEPVAPILGSDEGLASLMKALVDSGLRLEGTRKISALKGEGVAELLAETWAALPEGEPLYPTDDSLSDRPLRFFVSEKIREQLYLQLGEELPYACAVEVESYQEGTALDRVSAILHVERDSQKGMVIGKGGAKIKGIGSCARRSIETFVGKKVHLELRVSVWKDWSKNREALKRLGLDLPPLARHGRSQRKEARA
ncbi:MAG: GTPase Era [Bdellovibrionales bacterium]|nr:GTPase Era [Bdellovibrionales bacterium]